ncbi:hypothetical protein Bca4012_066297 [Brassica carinata]
MAGANLHLRHSYSTAQFVPSFSSPSPPPQRVRLGTSPSRVLFCNLRANSPTLRTTRRSHTVASVDSSTSSLVGDGDEVGKIPLLEVKDLRAVIVETRQEILKGVNLVVYEGEVHAVMGKNGSGKSTFSKVLVGHPDYEVTGGSIVFKGQNLVDMEPEERSLAGLFMSFQSPVEIPGVSNMDFLNMAFNARKRKLGQPELDPIQFYSHLVSKLEVVNMKTDFLNRNVNEGFSGGERKRNEILQLAVLGAELAILDEIDSGLDVDALQDVAKAVNGLLTPKNSVLMITHYQRLLDYIKPTLIHIMVSILVKRTFFTGLFGQNTRVAPTMFCIGASCMLLGFRRMEESLKPETTPWQNYWRRKATRPYPVSYISDHSKPLFLLLRDQSVVYVSKTLESEDDV